MQIKAARRGLRVVEVPVDYRPRIGRSKVSGTVSGTVEAGTKILALIARHAARPGRSVPALACGAVLTGCVAAGPPGPPPPRASASTSRSGAWPSPPTSRRSGPHAGPLSPRAPAWPSALALALAGRPRRRAAAAQRRHQPLRLGGADPDPRREPVRLGATGPASSAGSPLRDEVWDGINHRRMPAIYPPLFQLAVRGVIAVHDSVTAMKAFLVGRASCATLGAPGAGAPAPRPAARAPAGPGLEPPGPRRDRGQRATTRPSGCCGWWSPSWPWTLDRPLLSALAAGAGFMAKLLPGLVAAAWARRYRPVARPGRPGPGRRSSSGRTLDAGPDDVPQPVAVRAVLALQRDALRPARLAPREPRRGGAGRRRAHPGPRPGAGLAADRAGGRGAGWSSPPRCS